MKRQAGMKALSLAVLATLAMWLVALSASGCYAHVRAGYDDEYEVDGPPPALQEDVVVGSPGPGYVWIGGGYDWDAHSKAYAWHAGRWDRPPSEKAHWEGGHYEMRNGHHYYRPGHWNKG
jgi:hypothetical protein